MKDPINTALITISVALIALVLYIGFRYNVFNNKKHSRQGCKKAIRLKKVASKKEKPLTTFFTKDVMEYILTSYGSGEHKTEGKETGYGSYDWDDSRVDEET